jgi:hypothetical protein
MREAFADIVVAALVVRDEVTSIAPMDNAPLKFPAPVFIFIP